MRLTPKLDQLDYEILLALREDARMKAVLIARRTGSNERTVRNRIDRLLASGIVRLTTVMDMNACGFNITADVFVDLHAGHEDEVLAAIGETPEINYIAYGLDSNELSLQALFKDMGSFRLFLKRLQDTPHLSVTRYALVPTIIKVAADWMPGPEDLVQATAEIQPTA